MEKIALDKYYTPQNVVKKVFEILDSKDISSKLEFYLEPSAGDGAFLKEIKKRGIPFYACDIEPDGELSEIEKQDFLEFEKDIPKNACVIGNPPFGDRKNNLVRKFFKKIISLNAEYVAFILPIRQYNNPMSFYEYDLIYSEDIGTEEYSGIPIHCCINIYKRPKEIHTKKPNFTVEGVEIVEHHRTNSPILEDSDYRICSFGASIGKRVDFADKYCKELVFTFDEENKDYFISVLENTDFKKEFPSVSTPYVAKWQILRYLGNKKVSA